jgi:hypothetical protein
MHTGTSSGAGGMKPTIFYRTYDAALGVAYTSAGRRAYRDAGYRSKHPHRVAALVQSQWSIELAPATYEQWSRATGCIAASVPRAALEYWRHADDDTVGVSWTLEAATAYQQAGFVPVSATYTAQGREYTIAGPGNHADPGEWDRLTGLRATRAMEYHAAVCSVCGQFRDSPQCHKNRPVLPPARGPVYTTRPKHRARHPNDRTGRVMVDIVCSIECKRYFLRDGSPGEMGVAWTPDQALAYWRAGWTRIIGAGAVRDHARSSGAFTAGGPDRPCSARHFRRALQRRMAATDIPIVEAVQ